MRSHSDRILGPVGHSVPPCADHTASGGPFSLPRGMSYGRGQTSQGVKWGQKRLRAAFSGRPAINLSCLFLRWWSRTGSNRRPLECHSNTRISNLYFSIWIEFLNIQVLEPFTYFLIRMGSSFSALRTLPLSRFVGPLWVLFPKKLKNTHSYAAQ